MAAGERPSDALERGKRCGESIEAAWNLVERAEVALMSAAESVRRMDALVRLIRDRGLSPRERRMVLHQIAQRAAPPPRWRPRPRATPVIQLLIDGDSRRRARVGVDPRRRRCRERPPRQG
jgi:hypothetical protein